MADQKPALQEFFAESPLYSSIYVAAKDRSVDYSLARGAGAGSPPSLPVMQVLSPDSSVDAYCPKCEDKSIFVPVQIPADMSNDLRKVLAIGRPTYSVIKFHCSRKVEHPLFVAVYIEPAADRVRVTKIGMWPSFADLQLPLNAEYKKALSQEKLKELNTAVGLAAHEVGIGAFVYLRRIFEYLVDEVAKEAMASGEISTDTYRAKRMDERIEVLRAHLPPFLVEHQALYGIVSKGIHELTEDECRTYFRIVLTGIEIILDQKLEALRRKERERTGAAALQELTRNLKK